MKSPVNSEERAPTGHFLSLNKAFRIGLHLTELLVKRSHENLQATQAIGMVIGRSPQTHSKGPLLKTTPVLLIEHGEVAQVPSPPQSGVFGTGWHSARYQRSNRNTNPATNPVIYNDALPERY